MAYSYCARTSRDFTDAVAATRAAFAAEGFGILTEIDLAATLRDKLHAEVEPYLILGACNPVFASQAVAAEPSVGVLLPCNVVIRRTGEDTVIEAMDPEILHHLSQNPRLHDLADEVAKRVRAAVEAAAGQGA